MSIRHRKQRIDSVARLGNLLDFGQLSKPLATIYLPCSPTFLGNLCKGVKIFNICSEIIFGQLYRPFWHFLLVTLPVIDAGKKVAPCSLTED